jgi:hypothetical protein
MTAIFFREWGCMFNPASLLVTNKQAHMPG